MRKPGVITAAVAEFIRDKSRQAIESEVTRKATVKAAEAGLKRARVSVRTTTGRAAPTLTNKVPKTREEAREQVMKELQARLASGGD
jgi:hypothetical protein